MMRKNRSFLSRSRRRPRDEQPYAAGARPSTSDIHGGQSRFRLPHERDESTGSDPSPPRKVMEIARRDLDAGLVDTDLRNTAGLDAKQRTKLLGRAARKLRRAFGRGDSQSDEE